MKKTIQKKTYLNEDENKFFLQKMKDLKYTSEAEFLRDAIAAGIPNMAQYDPAKRLKNS